MANSVDIGSLDTLVTIRKSTITSGTQGQKVFTYTDHSEVYANVDRRVDETVNDGNLEEGKYVALTIYKIAELTTRWRVEIDDVEYEITGIDPIERVSPFCILNLHALG